MNIGVMGYYGFGNTGDEIILDNLRSFLAPHRVVPFPVGFPASREALKRLNNFDFLILGGGGLYNSNVPPSPFANFGGWLDSLDTPIGVLGLGMEKLDAPFLAATHKFVDKARFFIVRDEQSSQFIGHPKVQVAPDLTFYTPLQIAAYEKNEEEVICGVNLRPTRPGVSEWIKAISVLPCRKRAIPFSVHPELGDQEALKALDPTCPTQFMEDSYVGLDLMVGTAFHAVVLAIQAGVPAIAISYNPKVGRLMQEVGLAEYMLEWHEWDQLGALHEKTIKNQEIIREHMLAYTTAATEKLQRVLAGVKFEIEEANKKRHPYITSSIPDKPKVSIIVSGLNSIENDVRKTILSCLDQIHQNLEVILVIDSQPSEIIAQIKADARIQVINVNKNDENWFTTGYQLATGKYVTWLQAGSWYADDAISTLVSVFEANPELDLAYADFFITHAGIIERKIKMNQKFTLTQSNPFGPCLLIKREMVKDLWDKVTEDVSSKQGFKPLDKQIVHVHIPHNLLFKPATESEVCLYRSAIAYGRVQIEEAKQLLSRAVSLNTQLLDSEKAKVADLFIEVAGVHLITPKPEEFVDNVFQNLPQEARKLQSVKKKINSSIMMTRFFEAYLRQDWSNVLLIAWPGIRNDPAWLHNKGVWVILLRAFIAILLPERAA